MPSILHEGLIALVRERPKFAAELLEEVVGLRLPSFRDARIAEANLNELLPTEYTADLVVVLSDRNPVLGIILEAQLYADERKAIHLAALRGERARATRMPFRSARCDARCLDPPTGQNRPWSSAVEFEREPELAVLSIMAHGRGDPKRAVSIAFAATTAIENLPDGQRLLYWALIQSSLGEGARKAFEMLPPHIEKFLSEPNRQLFAKAKAQGRAEGEAAALLHILLRRGLQPTEEQRRLILDYSDLATLDRWLDRALTAASVDDLLA